MAAKPIKFPENDYLLPPVPDSARLLVGCRRGDYSASRLAHAVEDCNAHLINLNVTATDSPANIAADEYADPKFPIVVDLRVNLRNADAIARSLERYGYTVIDTDAPESASDDIARERLEHLWRYLNV
ncbi:MAG: hypothetical protein HDT06_02815 [Bacteroidales bacterium]|nr:hypothetical protein [Bacteroidales bacterium]